MTWLWKNHAFFKLSYRIAICRQIKPSFKALRPNKLTYLNYIKPPLIRQSAALNSTLATCVTFFLVFVCFGLYSILLISITSIVLLGFIPIKQEAEFEELWPRIGNLLWVLTERFYEVEIYEVACKPRTSALASLKSGKDDWVRL